MIDVFTKVVLAYTLPADGAIRGTWHLTGAYEDVQRVSLDPHPSSPIPHPFAFPLGSDLCYRRVIEPNPIVYPINLPDPDDPEPTPSISVSFDDDAVIYEDAYTNAPGNVVPWRSTATKLRLVCIGCSRG